VKILPGMHLLIKNTALNFGGKKRKVHNPTLTPILDIDACAKCYDGQHQFGALTCITGVASRNTQQYAELLKMASVAFVKDCGLKVLLLINEFLVSTNLKDIKYYQ